MGRSAALRVIAELASASVARRGGEPRGLPTQEDVTSKATDPAPLATFLSCADAVAAYLAPLRRTKWFVYAKRPFAGPAAVLAYLSRYTHRVALSNRRLIAADGHRVTFRYKDYRRDGRDRYRTM